MAQTPIPEWLKRLQENSWELELLISGGAVFTLVQFPELYLEWMESIRYMSQYDGFGIFLILGLTGLKILTNGFILHLILRSFWLALVCVNYIYPQGINSRRVNRNGPFSTRHTGGDLQEHIMYIDRLCGLVIYMAITATIILVGLLVILGFFVALSAILMGIVSRDAWSWTGKISVTLVVVYGVDLLSMGLLRRIPYVSWLLFPGFWLLDRLSLRPLYDRALVLFSSNVKRSHFWLGAIAFSSITLCTVYLTVFRIMHWPNMFDKRKYVEQLAPTMFTSERFYADQTDRPFSIYIPSQIIEHNFLGVNIRYEKRLDFLIDQSSPIDSLRSLAGITEVLIDDSVYQNVKWHPIRRKQSSDVGLVAYIPISHLANGEHKLRVQVKKIDNPIFLEELNAISELGRLVSIPFWKDVH